MCFSNSLLNTGRVNIGLWILELGLLFLVYIDKVANSVLYITMYADDIALCKVIRNLRDYTMQQDGIKTICNCVADNHTL